MQFWILASDCVQQLKEMALPISQILKYLMNCLELSDRLGLLTVHSQN